MTIPVAPGGSTITVRLRFYDGYGYSRNFTRASVQTRSGKFSVTLSAGSLTTSGSTLIASDTANIISGLLSLTSDFSIVPKYIYGGSGELSLSSLTDIYSHSGYQITADGSITLSSDNVISMLYTNSFDGSITLTGNTTCSPVLFVIADGILTTDSLFASNLNFQTIADGSMIVDSEFGVLQNYSFIGDGSFILESTTTATANVSGTTYSYTGDGLIQTDSNFTIIPTIIRHTGSGLMQTGSSFTIGRGYTRVGSGTCTITGQFVASNTSPINSTGDLVCSGSTEAEFVRYTNHGVIASGSTSVTSVIINSLIVSGTTEAEYVSTLVTNSCCINQLPRTFSFLATGGLCDGYFGTLTYDAGIDAWETDVGSPIQITMQCFGSSETDFYFIECGHYFVLPTSAACDPFEITGLLFSECCDGSTLTIFVGG